MKRWIAFGVCVVLAAPVFAQQEIVSAERKKFGTLVSPAEAPALLTAVARRLPGGPWGLLVKTEGNNCGGYACDIVCNGSEHFDVLIDAPDATEHYAGTARAAWQPKGPYAPRTCAYVSPEPPAPPPAQPPPQTPPPAPVASCDLSPLYLQLSQIQVTCQALKAGQDDHASKFAEHAKSLEEHRADVKGFWEKYWPQIVTGAITGIVGAVTAWQSKNAKPAPAPAQ